MINVSDKYLEAITAPSEMTTFWAEFSFIPPGAQEGATLASSLFGKLCGNTLAQLNNGVSGMGARWRTLERNRCILGKRWTSLEPQSDAQTGDWSVVGCNDNGEFTEPPYIEYILDVPYDLIGIQVVFDDRGAEWPTEFKVSYYGSAAALISERVLSNDSANRPVDYPENNVKVIRLTVLRWNLPRRVAKVCQIIPGQIRYFRDDNTYSFLLKEAITPFAPLIIPEYTITFPNENQTYNIINPEGLISKLREFMEIPSRIGIDTGEEFEYVNTGDFYLFSWPDSANDETAAFNCRPDLAFSNKPYVPDGPEIQTVAQIAARISVLANLHSPIAVDSSIAGVRVNSVISENVPLVNALAQLATAAGGYVKFKRGGTYEIKPLSFGLPTRVITHDNMWEKAQITQMPPVAGVKVRYLQYSKGQEELIPSGRDTGNIVDINSDFIMDADSARVAGLAALNYYAARRLRFGVRYRGDMSIEAGDIVSVETDYGFSNVLVTSLEITYKSSDFLQGKLDGVGV